MSRRQNPIPTYRLHPASGQAIVALPDGLGGRRAVYLGAYDTEESRQAYRRVLAEWEASGRRATTPGQQLTVAEMVALYWDFATGYYRDQDGNPSGQLENVRYALRPLTELYADTEAAEFGPLALKAIQKHLVSSGLCRREVNARVSRIRRSFKWATSEQLLPVTVYQSLTTVEGLKLGRTDAPETEPVRPVSVEVVEATLPYLRPPVAAMVRVQMLCGCRPAEVCVMRGADLDRSGTVWKFSPDRHKNRWRGHRRVIHLGPRAQAVLTPFLKDDPEAYIFSPAADERVIAAEKRSKRKTPLWSSHVRRLEKQRKANPRRTPTDRYVTHSYNRAIARGCERAGVERWTANRLRHSAGTRAREQYGVEGAQHVLGHTTILPSQIYAQKSEALAERVALSWAERRTGAIHTERSEMVLDMSPRTVQNLLCGPVFHPTATRNQPAAQSVVRRASSGTYRPSPKGTIPNVGRKSAARDRGCETGMVGAPRRSPSCQYQAPVKVSSAAMRRGRSSRGFFRFHGIANRGNHA